ncbi:Carboxypeptidase regulatory-like domain-containing protein [Zhouia amylolytica]|uniref:Carboxypeptidase regulatory-like domain-containing protein n=1 Tax=Zhouia amylolytica TaxID=376730 RepID=A0A1I6PB69_9FLAO|nr:DUF4382 domain-containing protein [Zhouia amylolytica]MCQ0111397.1 DUF4382 domain-containing protein [Zhouia amylolytica]SFS37462.1 Carboxypeptidase regulatory-like domain-containing protein [Zhouia amylolytica]
MILKRMSLLVLMVSTAFLTSCSDNNDQASTGTMAVHMTDAPFPYEMVAEANVTITKIEARNTSIEEGTEEGAEEEGMETSSSPFVVLMEEEVTLNLLELTNGVTETLANVEIPTGTYDLVRVYIKEAGVVLTDGTPYTLKVPSGASSGLKIFLEPGITVSGGLTSDLLLDFDISQSFVPVGDVNAAEGITSFNFNPVIKASNLSTAGTLTGAVTTIETTTEGDTVTETAVGLEGATITILNGEEIVTSAIAGAEGAYTVLGLDAGTYTVMVEIDGYTAQTVEGVEVVAANQTTQNFELVAAE